MVSAFFTGDVARMASANVDPCKLEGKKCMCHVCDCGRHKCPTLHISSNVHYPKNLESEYAWKYTKWPVQERPRPKPFTLNKDGPKFDGTTTHHTDYRLWPLNPRSPMKPPTTCLDSNTKLDDKTTYNLNYWDKSKVHPRPEPSKRQSTIQSDAQFYSETTHHHDFGPKPLPKRSPPIRHDTDNVGDPNHHTFDADTTYHYDYKAWPVYPHHREDPGKSRMNAGPEARFCGETNYKHDYVAHKLPKKCATLTRPRPQKFEGDHFIYDN
ncbi:hypothetical protein KP509_28G054900 [Ceratopteris richardii]|uniref:Uncharacterized protein n=1 Tax=Ceratopteris richardii TaxID=49495 RepID=A0A8T2RE87_CERRI|nr:hypothetical protein KP509_28G054900 [Ceratopteris richardii]